MEQKEVEVMKFLPQGHTNEVIRQAMHDALDAELDREMSADNWRWLSVTLSLGVEEVLNATSTSKRYPEVRGKGE